MLVTQGGILSSSVLSPWICLLRGRQLQTRLEIIKCSYGEEWLGEDGVIWQDTQIFRILSSHPSHFRLTAAVCVSGCRCLYSRCPSLHRLLERAEFIE